MTRKIISVLLIALLLIVSLAAYAEDKKVNKIDIVKEPDKVNYWVGEELTLEGGILKVTYSDKTTEEIPMTAEGVTTNAVATNVSGTKTVKLTYGGKKKSFTVTINDKGGSVTLDCNYEGAPEAQVIYTVKAYAAELPGEPVRDGYSFDRWYTDKNCTVAYDVSRIVNEDITLYAGWLQNGAAYHTVSYNVNYYGAAVKEYAQFVQDGENARELALTPERNEFSFDGWYTDAACTDTFNASAAPITADTTVYAKWNKTKSGVSAYVFEAENTDLTGKTGPGVSGSATGTGMIINAEGASGGRAVSYLYKEGVSLDFPLAVSEEVTDAVLKIDLSSEFNFTLAPGMYSVLVNGEPVSYNAVALTGGMPYGPSVIIEGVHLLEGENVINLVTANSQNPAGEGMGTYQGTAPIIDAIEIETSAVVSWDGAKGLPMAN